MAFNPAGEGPRSDPVSVKTLQGVPEPPANLKFGEITMNTLKVSWDPPVKPNGEILGYIVAYETAEQDESKYRITSNNSRPLIIPAGKKGKKLIIPAGIIRGNTVFNTFLG